MSEETKIPFMNIKQIVAVRKANEIKQYDFAQLLGIPVGTWSNVELENVPLYSDVRAKAVAALKDLGCDFSILKTPEKFAELPRYVGRTTSSEEKVKVTVDVPTEEVSMKETLAKAFPQLQVVVEGVSKEEPRVTNQKGGSQSRTLYDFSLADPKAMFEMTKVLKEGADKYGRENWRLIDINDHLNHMIIHAYAYLAGDRTDEHLSHIMCRALFAQGVALQTPDDIERAIANKQQGEL